MTPILHDSNTPIGAKPLSSIPISSTEILLVRPRCRSNRFEYSKEMHGGLEDCGSRFIPHPSKYWHQLRLDLSGVDEDAGS